MRKTFEEWMKDVDDALIGMCSMASDELPDCAYRDCYDGGYTAVRMAKKAYANAREEVGL